MKKSLIALAVASAVSAPAFAATSNVDIYGVLHVSVSAFDDQAGTGAGSNDVQVTSNPSRIGFKGTEDLGGGLAAIWQVESSVNLDESGGTWAGRNSFVGLKGGFGTALLGRHDTPLKLVGRAVDLFGDTMADSRNVTGVGSDTRANNVVAYISPSFSGLSFAAAYTTDLSDAAGALAASEADGQDAYNLNATYTNGPLFLGLGYGDGDAHELLGFGAHWRAAAGFTFGNFKVVGQYDRLKDEDSVAAAAANQLGDFDSWMLGAAYTMGNVVLKANYMEGEEDNCNVAGCDTQQWTIGADYNLSKRTTVYALYADGENITFGAGAGSTDTVTGGAPAGTDAEVSMLSVGLKHSF